MSSARAQREAFLALGYFALYLGYLFLHQENELAHWVTLVALPALGLWWLRGLHRGRRSLLATLGSVGLVRSRATAGLGTAFAVAAAAQPLQLLNGRQRDAIIELLSTGRGLLLLPLAFALLVGTAAFTEEFFFRGVLQSRLTALFQSSVWGVIAASVLFALFHFPYAYLDDGWRSVGDPLAALQLAAANGIFGGLVLGAVFVRARGNLLAPITVHAAINLIPATLFLQRIF